MSKKISARFFVFSGVFCFLSSMCLANAATHTLYFDDYSSEPSEPELPLASSPDRKTWDGYTCIEQGSEYIARAMGVSKQNPETRRQNIGNSLSIECERLPEKTNARKARFNHHEQYTCKFIVNNMQELRSFGSNVEAQIQLTTNESRRFHELFGYRNFCFDGNRVSMAYDGQSVASDDGRIRFVGQSNKVSINFIRESN